MRDREILRDLVAISRRAARLGYAVAGEGNTSGRSSSKQGFWIKRSGCSLEEASTEDFVQVEIEAAARGLEEAQKGILKGPSGSYRPSIEVAMHALIYRSQDRARFIVHTHPPCALSGCCTEDIRDFFVPQFPDSVVYLGRPEESWIFLDYAPPGPKIAQLLGRALEGLDGELRVVILAKHGVITVGETAAEAMSRTELLEKASYVRLMSAMAGAATRLADEEVRELESMESERYRQRVLKGRA